MSPKEFILAAIHELPDEAPWELVKERIDFAFAIGVAREEVREGKFVPHEEVQKALATWTEA